MPNPARLAVVLSVVLSVVLTVVLLPWTPLGADEDEAVRLQATWRDLEVRLLERLHDLASYCQGAKLFASRAEVYEGILALAPDDETARKWLRYERAADGSWVRDSRYKPPRNLRRGVEDFEARRTALGAWFAEQAGPLWHAARDAGLPGLAAEVQAVGIAVDPESATLRGWNREVQDDGRWILEETVAARERRPGIRQAAADALARTPAPKTGVLTDDDRRGDVGWQHVWQGELVRVVGMVDEAELEQALRNAEATWPVFAYAFRARPPTYPGSGYGRGLTIYVADSKLSGNEYLAAQPGVEPRFVDFVRPLIALWIPSRPAVLIKSELGTMRLEAAARQVFQAAKSNVLGLTARRAWAAEGMGLYLTFQITHSRMIYSVADVTSRYGEENRPVPDYERELDAQDANWLALGAAMLDGPDKPDLFLLAGKDVNHLTRADVLYAYCLVAYLIEGHPERCRSFFQELASEAGADLDAVCLRTLGFDAHTMERRLRRWLEETSDLPTR